MQRKKYPFTPLEWNTFLCEKLTRSQHWSLISIYTSLSAVRFTQPPLWNKQLHVHTLRQQLNKQQLSAGFKHRRQFSHAWSSQMFTNKLQPGIDVRTKPHSPQTQREAPNCFPENTSKLAMPPGWQGVSPACRRTAELCQFFTGKGCSPGNPVHGSLPSYNSMTETITMSCIWINSTNE